MLWDQLFLKCQDYPSCWDQKFLKPRLFSQDFVASIFLSRLSRRIEIVKICRDASRFVEKSQHYQDLLSLNMMKSLDGLRNLDKKMQKSMHFLIKIETNCWETPKFSDLDKFLDWDFSKIFENVKIFWTVKTNSLTMSRLRQIETPMLKFLL